MAQLKKFPFGVNTKIELKSITATSDNTGALLSQRTLLEVTIFGWSCYISELNRSINCKWQFMVCAPIAFSERYVLRISFSLQKFRFKLVTSSRSQTACSLDCLFKHWVNS